MPNEKPDFRIIYKELHAQMDQPGFRPMIRAASKIFDAPIIYTDDKYQLVALYPAQKIGDEVYDTLLDAGVLPEETIAAYQKSYLSDPGRRYDPFFEKSGLVKNYPRIFAEIYDENKVYGHIAIFLKNKNCKPWQLEAAAILTDLLRIKINLSRQLPALQADTLHDLLNRKTSRQASDRLIRHLFNKPQINSLLLVAPLDQTKSQHAVASLAINYLMHKFANAIPVVYEDDLVILLTEDQHHQDLKTTAEAISAYLNHYQILCGGVYPVNDLRDLPDFYLQGRLTALYSYWQETGNKETTAGVTYYHQLAPAPLFVYLSQKEETRCFIHGALKLMKKYDQKNESDYFNTIISYCQHLFQKKETAQTLHIHRNTLNYRLEKITELFSLDLTDYQTMLNLMLSAELLKYFD
ncbi:helix-turn-helix domain-containing protein [Eubacteriaceae bacterium ES2]|nr:helix-turn-helix domain-containing protein [Eubacteriaceae bacterium ES2]